MSKDLFLVDQLRAVGETYLGVAEDKVAFARRMVDHWTLVARVEQRQAERLDWRRRGVSKTPSGTFAGVHEALSQGHVDHSRAKTERHDMTPYVEAAEAEHRPTPVVPDARKDPE